MQVLARAHLVIRTLAESSEGLTAAQLSERLRMPATSLHRLLAELQHQGFVSRQAAGARCYLGPAALEVGLGALRPAVLASGACVRMVTELAEELGERAVLVEMRARRAVLALDRGPRHWSAAYVQTREVVPFRTAAAARALLLDLTEVEVGRLLADQDPAPDGAGAFDSVQDLSRRLGVVRRRGFEIAYGECAAESWEMAAPVRNGAGRVIAALAVVTHRSRLRRRGASRIRAAVLGTARAVSAELGYEEGTGP
ncbi:IclR family transcriptional regulator domain-containing protein [Streptomyces sp. NBC_00503]|uniref:IclR family transcriptional regulator domain-containing protein n=1 Tax=Streptomyces sp. NBC_00503 TaxID=2903659 RepID=UPI002E7FF57E|nr:IclR family transcriptional regulator C-terminal domain-containing protein [Streptomyces sp. NBC_00503]WUD86500.1 helix-turn-helix domain-containing protein [Streptomyces sp. NBC_00503]